MSVILRPLCLTLSIAFANILTSDKNNYEKMSLYIEVLF